MIGKRMMLCLLLALQLAVICGCRNEAVNTADTETPDAVSEIPIPAEKDAVTTGASTTTFTEPASEEVRSRFMVSDDFEVIRQTALAFFEAYRNGDDTAAMALLDTPDNPCLEHSFPLPAENDTKSSGLVLAGNGEINLINCFTDQDGNVVRVAIDLGVTNDPRPEYTMGTHWLAMTLVLQESTDDTGALERRWCITQFGLSA